MSFRLSSVVDKDKIFLVKYSELEGRLDPFFYKPEFQNLIDCLNLSSFKIKRLSSVLKRVVNGFDCRDYVNSGTMYLKVANVKENKIVLSGVNYIPEQRIEKDVLVLEGDLLLTRKGSFGIASIVSHEANNSIISSEIFKLVVSNELKKEYLSYWFNTKFCQMYFYRIKTGAIMGHISQEALKNVLIPIPPKTIQAKIVAKMDKAYSNKKQKEAEAQQLLDSIDDYLLGELGIELPEQQENSIQSRIFTRKLSKVSGGRFDAPIHHKKFSLQSNKYQMEKIPDCVLINPSNSSYSISPEISVTFIPMDSVSAQYGEADVSESRLLKENSGYTKFQEDDLLWAKITPCMQNGKSAVVSNLKNSIGFGSTEFHVFRAKSDINIRFIHAIFRLRSLRNYGVLYFSGSAGHQRVSDEFFKQLSIPKPPLKKQTEIANHITDIRKQAKKLQQQAKDGLEKAKQEVETMILGD